MNQSKADLSAREAAELLGVKLPTLYAYVSRGLLRSRPVPGRRARRYERAEVLALKHRHENGGDPLGWGEPVLASGITQMTPRGPSYRGRDALELARAHVAFERVAELLWTGVLPDAAPRWPRPALEPLLPGLRALLPEDAPFVARAPVVVAALAARDPARFDVRPEAVQDRARGLVRALAAALAPPGEPERVRRALAADTVARAVVAAHGLRAGAPVRRGLDRALIAIADHELNASTFAARVVASTRADLYAATSAGLAALSGPLHGGATDQVEALLAATPRASEAAAVVHGRTARGEALPGFGHPYYPDGDPRAALLLETARSIASGQPGLEVLEALAHAMAEAGRPAPNVDFGLVALRVALGLPRGAAAGLFAVGRVAGWSAHVMEQHARGHLLRPRARYAPEPPEA
jgi:citrate synthase